MVARSGASNENNINCSYLSYALHNTAVDSGALNRVLTAATYCVDTVLTIVPNRNSYFLLATFTQQHSPLHNTALTRPWVGVYT